MKIAAINRELETALQHKIDQKTKPPGALGKLEHVALQIGLIQQSLEPVLQNPQLLLFAGDHGLVQAGVSPYPQEVTQQMVMNFVAGGAAINVFCRQHNIAIDVVDAGVNGDLSGLDIVHAKVAQGTANCLEGPAMTAEQFEQACKAARQLVVEKHSAGCNVIGFGEMGIGNTSSAALVFSVLSGMAVEDCVGRGTGLDDAGLAQKKAVLRQVINRHQGVEKTAPSVLQAFGGFELVMIYAAALQAAELNMIVLVDGFIATAAIAAAIHEAPALQDYCLFSHLSDEHAHKMMLDYLGVEPLLQLNMRLGEGSGVAITYPLIESAIAFLNEMASFESAGVSDKE